MGTYLPSEPAWDLDIVEALTRNCRAKKTIYFRRKLETKITKPNTIVAAVLVWTRYPNVFSLDEPIPESSRALLDLYSI